MKKFCLFSCILGLFSYPLLSQEIISSGGDFFENSNGSISMTAGEPITETFSSGSNILTQGFQQSRWSFVSIFELNENDINISVAPNPTSDIIYLYVDKFQNLNFQLCDIFGKIVKESHLYNEETKLSLSGMASGIYVLNIRQGTKPIETFQLVKN
jgi:hypothetical protein